MDPFTGYLILFVVGWMLRSGVQHARDDFKRTRDEELKAATVKAGKANKTLTPSVRNKLRRQHRTGWWASEIGRGFPVTRTGVHTGWLAHQAAAMHTRAQREMARTTHLDATASFASAVKEQRRMQQAARDDIEAALAESPVKQDGSRKAVKEAAGATVLPFPDRQPPVVKGPDPQRGGFCGIVGCKRGASVLVDGTWVCAECAGLVNRQRQQPEPGPYAVRDDARTDDSDHLRPGQLRCEACGGSGGNPEGTSNCRICRGWGSAAPDPGSLVAAPEGAICAACGRPGTEDNPVLAEPDGTHCHRSHLTEAHARYQRDMNGCTECGEPLGLRDHDGWAHHDCSWVSNVEAGAAEVRDNRDPEVVEAELGEQGRCCYQTGTDGGVTYCGRNAAESGDDDGERGDYCAEHEADVSGDDRSAARHRNERVKDLLFRDHEVNHSNPTEGESLMSGDTTFGGVKQASTAAIGAADQDTATIRGRKDAAYALADEMQSLNVDPAVIDAQMSYADSLAQAESHLVAAGEFATATGSNLERYHGAVQEAADSSPGRMAERSFHQDS